MAHGDPPDDQQQKRRVVTPDCPRVRYHRQECIKKLNLEDSFEIIHSGEFEEKGKPDPAIYVSTLNRLNLNANQVFAIEDSYNGLLSAKAANLKTVVMPEESVWQESKYDMADLKIKSLLEFSEEHFNLLEKKKAIDNKT